MTNYQAHLFSIFEDTNKSSLSTEEIDTRLFFDYTDEREQLYEIDVAAPSPIIDEIAELFDGEPGILHPTETNDMPDQTQSTDEHLAMIKPSDHSLQTSRQSVEKLPAKDHLDSSIELSKSVAVTVPTPNQLKIVYQLEDTYRARYKSDYFPQNGSCRRPRYVADKEGNHYVTIQMPSGYKRDLTNEYIRVALITTSIDGRGHFYSPYKFQTNHRDSKVLDQNPIFLPAQAQKQNQSTMKLQLVLIKSKLDQLNDAQPLKQFPDTISIQNIINEEKLAPKDLINTYQLDKSHIAFTLCTKLPNGSYNVHSETTVISSIITESSSKQSAAPTNKTKTNRKPIEKIICCPHCNHSFDPANVKVTQQETKRKSNNFKKLLKHIEMIADSLSVEEHISNFPNFDDDLLRLLDTNHQLKNVCYEESSDDTSIDCSLIEFIDPKNCGIEKSELDPYLPPINRSQDTICTDYDPNLFFLDFSISSKERADGYNVTNAKSNHVPLSSSVGVTMPKKSLNLSRGIEVVDDLELEYKPRYKSDYHSQDGTIRKPRYVANRDGTHCVRLKVAPGSKGYLRVDWTTTELSKGIRYSMPYKFQIDNDSFDSPDVNPFYVDFTADNSGMLGLYLVLIKAKQDELKSLQLQLFPPFEDCSSVSIANSFDVAAPLTAKKLIEQYQLEKSQLAFTLCTLSKDGQLFLPDWSTTVYSTVMTEISTETSKKRKIACPRCKNSFEITVNKAGDISYQEPAKKRKR
ncbi:unnamed protein product [Rotaria magnacalcarata]|nr:unnamed protein product [Rotaria magnacalcarata]